MTLKWKEEIYQFSVPRSQINKMTSTLAFFSLENECSSQYQSVLGFLLVQHCYGFPKWKTNSWVMNNLPSQQETATGSSLVMVCVITINMRRNWPSKLDMLLFILSAWCHSRCCQRDHDWKLPMKTSLPSPKSIHLPMCLNAHGICSDPCRSWMWQMLLSLQRIWILFVGMGHIVMWQYASVLQK